LPGKERCRLLSLPSHVFVELYASLDGRERWEDMPNMQVCPYIVIGCSTTISRILCRSKINNNTLQKFTVKSKPVAEAKSRINNKRNEPSPQSHRVIIYNTLCMAIHFLIDAQYLTISLGPEVLEAIQQVQILGTLAVRSRLLSSTFYTCKSMTLGQKASCSQLGQTLSTVRLLFYSS